MSAPYQDLDFFTTIDENDLQNLSGKSVCLANDDDDDDKNINDFWDKDPSPPTNDEYDEEVFKNGGDKEEVEEEEEEEEIKVESTESESDKKQYTNFPKCGLKILHKEEDNSSDRFSTALWSGRDESTSRSVNSWNVSTAGPVPWDDSQKPIERLLNYADLTLTKEEENGLLTDRIVAACSSYLTDSPGNKCRVVAKVSLTNKNLNDIRVLSYHRFLQYVDLSWNNLTDLTPLGCIPYLMYLDVSHNLMEEVLRFRPPLNLTYVNYSYNQVWQIDNLSDFWSLTYLDLSHNKISKIQGLHNLKYLRYLDLSHNKIERFENLNNLRITDLNLEYNLLSRFETEMDLGIHTMPYLTNLYLNNNLIKDLKFLKNVHSLKKLELQGNDITDLLQLTNMKKLKNLRQLDLSNNDVSKQKPYRNLILSFLRELKFLDQTEVNISERVAACKHHKYDLQLEAARNNARMLLLEQLNDVTMDMDVLPYDQGPYPFVILVGPSASSKKSIISSLAEKYPEKIYIGKLHTTRKILDGEKHLLKHVNRENFNCMIQSGKFLSVYENLGHFYGFSKSELGNAVAERKLCLTCMDMVSALTIYGYGIRPFLVLVIPESKEEHVKRLKLTYGPVISRIGAAYMAQRQLVHNHENNIKRVENVLDELIRKMFDKIYGEKSEPYNVVDDDYDGHDDKIMEKNDNQVLEKIFHADKEGISTETLSGNSSIFGCNAPGKNQNSFTCSPSRCGFQKCMGRNNNNNNEKENSEESQSHVTSENYVGEMSTSSYSADLQVPIKVEIGSSDLSTYGEEDPFADLSMPFVNWSEVNLTGLQLEEAAEILCEQYIENVMSTRDVYENLHLDNPGLFSLCVFTNDIENSIKSITKLLKEIWRTTGERQPVMVPQKLDQLKEILQNDFLSSGDGSSKLFNFMVPSSSPATICREMKTKGFGDSFNDF
ncbi:protein phosphatases pp1 regulatory subunit, putative [Pediculus humanus corporis]|uniref:Protein phosphatases pp1 regulatory subunit, putative n=1 Tax=Pediculus humanus subsp. corporis TaxID=121224 RepID=E0VE51_PEDHC|nr:protein phosphatases pp1 regulatory subunit, putative [Pediculus humanus corporis]EEB11657.1 protein phosphatases pp1 regulatory subunit, putative [Pediculus humanus corporis]